MSSTTSCSSAGDDRGHIELELGDNQRDVQRMSDVGLARLALLLAMHPRRVIVGAADQREVGFGIVGTDPAHEFVELPSGSLW